MISQLLALAMALNLTGTIQIDEMEKARDALMSALQKRDESAICDAIESLAGHDQEESAELMLRFGMAHESLLVHQESLRLLRAFESQGAREAIRTAARKARDPSRRLDALRVLRAWPQSLSRPELLLSLKDRSWLVVSEAVRGLRDHRAAEAVGALIDRMPDAQGRLLEDFRETLITLTGQSLPPEADQWRIWWRDSQQDWQPPAPKPDKSDDEQKSLPTAVRQGLYGEIVSERVIFLLDVSGSMLAETSVGGSRIEIGKDWINPYPYHLTE